MSTQGKRVKCRTPKGEIHICHYTPLTDPKRALKYADILSDKFNDVVVQTRGDRITVTARNVH